MLHQPLQIFVYPFQINTTLILFMRAIFILSQLACLCNFMIRQFTKHLAKYLNVLAIDLFKHFVNTLHKNTRINLLVFIQLHN